MSDTKLNRYRVVVTWTASESYEVQAEDEKDARDKAIERAYDEHPFADDRYLTLDKLIAETRPILSRHGLSIIQAPSAVERGEDGMVPALHTLLVHVSGERESFCTPLYLGDKSMQGLGAAITYARRYAWAAVLGIAAEEDTDAPSEPVLWGVVWRSYQRSVLRCKCGAVGRG